MHHLDTLNNCLYNFLCWSKYRIKDRQNEPFIVLVFKNSAVPKYPLHLASKCNNHRPSLFPQIQLRLAYIIPTLISLQIQIVSNSVRKHS